jgi:hypothetical protein
MGGPFVGLSDNGSIIPAGKGCKCRKQAVKRRVIQCLRDLIPAQESGSRW